jgi:hypothetical protein
MQDKRIMAKIVKPRMIVIGSRFVNKAQNDLIKGKIHILRSKYSFWKNFEGKDIKISIAKDSFKYGKNKEICVKRVVSVQDVIQDEYGSFRVSKKEGGLIPIRVIAKNEGFDNYEEFIKFSKKWPPGELVILHLTDLWYEGNGFSEEETRNKETMERPSVRYHHIEVNPRFVNAAGDDLIEGKIHIIEKYHTYWDRLVGKNVALFTWEGKPLRSKQKVFCVKKLVSVQYCSTDMSGTFWLSREYRYSIPTVMIAKNDGFDDFDEFKDFYKRYSAFEMAVLHFTEFRYKKYKEEENKESILPQEEIRDKRVTEITEEPARSVIVNPRLVNEAGDDLIEGKIHIIIKATYSFWKRFEGKNIEILTERVFNGEKKKICVKRIVSVQKIIKDKDDSFWISRSHRYPVYIDEIANNEGFYSFKEFIKFSKKWRPGEMVILHFTDFRYTD